MADARRPKTRPRVRAGIGPAKALVNASVVKAARDAGLTITPYTFRSRDSGQFTSVREEMNHFLYTLGADAVFTDNPDEFPRQRLSR